MGGYYRCPACKAVLQKSPEDEVYSKVGGLVMTSSDPWARYVKCSNCGHVIDRTEIWNGTYDVEIKKWWQFWK